MFFLIVSVNYHALIMKWEYRSKVFVGVEFIVNKFQVRIFSYITHLVKTNRTICSDRKNMDFSV